MSADRIDEVFRAINCSDMKYWVGFSDPQATGLDSFETLKRNIAIRSEMNIFDLGCGIGRTAVYLADFLTDGLVVGTDIVPKQIEFCKTEVASRFKNANFFLTNDHNVHYDNLIGTDGMEGSVSVENFVTQHRKFFDVAVAFSVFTHFTPEMTSSYLGMLFDVLKFEGVGLATCFLDNSENPADRRLFSNENYRDCDPERPLLFSVYDYEFLSSLFKANNLRIRLVQYGDWRTPGSNGKKLATHLQDIIVFDKLATLPEDFEPAAYLSLHPDVARNGFDGARHYLQYGYYEGRAYRA